MNSMQMISNTIDNMSVCVESTSSQQEPTTHTERNIPAEIVPKSGFDTRKKKDELKINEELFGWSQLEIRKFLCAFILFTIITMTAGIIIVCLTASKGKDASCKMSFERKRQSESVSYSSKPQHVAVADFNQDNHQDLVIANTGFDSIGIRLGYENGTFGNQTFFSTGNGSQPYWVAAKDFNNDNHLDIAVANYGSRSIGIFLGDGNGNFSNKKIFSLNASRPLALDVGHVNNDSQWDLVVITNGTLNVLILYGRDDGSFEMGKSYYMGHDSMPCSIVVADLNNDHRSDIVVVNYGTSELVLLLSSPVDDQTFRTDRYSTGRNAHPTSVTVEYLNDDPYLDIAVANSGTHTIGVFLGHGDGHFQQMRPYAVTSTSDSCLQFIVAGWFDKDDFCDLAVIDSRQNDVILFTGDGTGLFSTATIQSTGHESIPYAMVVTDFNNDDQLDLVVVNHGDNDILLLSSYVHQSIADQVFYSTGSPSPNFISVADMTNDGHLDILVTKNNINDAYVLIGLGDGAFRSQKIDHIFSQAYAHAIGDLNNDKKLDFVVVMPALAEIDIFFGQGNGSFDYGGTYSLEAGSHPSSIVVVDLDNNYHLDIVIANEVTNNLAIFASKGGGNFSEAMYYNFTNGDISPAFIATADFNNDSFSDLVTVFFNSPTVTILLGTSKGTFEKPERIKLDDYYASWIVIADLDNDAKPDIVLISSDNSIMQVLLGHGDGTFQNSYTYTIYDSASLFSAAIGNINKDSIPDIVIADAIDPSVSVLFRDTDGDLIGLDTFYLQNDFSAYFLATGDFNNDSITDIAVANSDNSGITILLIKYEFIFRDQRNYDQGSAKHPHSITMADFDNDHQMDVAVANTGDDNVQLLMKYQDGRFQSEIILSTGDNSYPRDVVAADFDQNGLVDITVVNYRKHTLMVFLNPSQQNSTRSFVYSTGSGSFPTSICIGDVNKDGWTDVIVTNSHADSVGIFLGYNYPTFITGKTIQLKRGSMPNLVVIADFNNDSFWDLVIGCQQTSSIEILLGDINGDFIHQEPTIEGDCVGFITFLTGDVNNDDQLDLVVGCSVDTYLYVFLGDGNGRFSSPINSYGYGFCPDFIASGDFDHDGRLDIVIADRAARSIQVFLGFGNGSFVRRVFYLMTDGSVPVWLAVDDLNNDTNLDLVVAGGHGDNIRVYFGSGDGTFYTLAIYSTGNDSAPCSVATADLDKDNCTDIVVLNVDAKNIGIFFGDGSGTFSSPMIYSMKSSSDLTEVVVEDFNNDTILDIAVTYFTTGNGDIAILYGLGERRFLMPKIYSTEHPSQIMSMAVKDLNNDGQLEIVVAITKKDTIGIMFISTNDFLGSLMTFHTGYNSSPSAVSISDLNNDTRPDIAVVSSKTNEVLILLGDGNGRFQRGTTHRTGLNAAPSSIVISDVDGDQHDDILVTNSQIHEIGIFFSYGNGNFTLVQSYRTGDGSEPSSIIIADLNRDNLMDIIVANTGISTVVIFYGTGNRTFSRRESHSLGYDYRPRSVVVGDVNNDGWLDIGIANYGTGSVDILLHTCEPDRSIL